MPDDNGILEAEHRVREMNRVTRQYSEQGNRFLQNMRDPPQQAAGQTRQVRFEPAVQSQNGQDGSRASPVGGRQYHNNGVRNARQDISPDIPPAPEREPPAVPKNRQNNAGRAVSGGNTMFPDITADTEKLMILLLIYLLMREKADIKLLLALGYLLL